MWNPQSAFMALSNLHETAAQCSRHSSPQCFPPKYQDRAEDGKRITSRLAVVPFAAQRETMRQHGKDDISFIIGDVFLQHVLMRAVRRYCKAPWWDFIIKT